MVPPVPPPAHPGLLLPQRVTRSDSAHVPKLAKGGDAHPVGTVPGLSPQQLARLGPSQELEKRDETAADGWSSFPPCFCPPLGKPKESQQNGEWI